MKIGHRLQQLDHMITEYYDEIWDCCCDHGLLGMTLIKRGASAKVHFVDIVAPLMSELEAKLERFFPKSLQQDHWQVHCQDVATLSLKTDQSKSNIKRLVIIAGVGGDRMIELISSIIQKHPKQTIELLLCPVHHNYKVRQTLSRLELGLIDEKIVKENNRFYELIHVSSKAKQIISTVGSLMWDFSRNDDRDYLKKTIQHYQLKSKANPTQFEPIISAYASLNKK